MEVLAICEVSMEGEFWSIKSPLFLVKWRDLYKYKKIQKQNEEKDYLAFSCYIGCRNAGDD